MNVHSSDRARNEHNPPHSIPDVFGGDLALGRVHSGRVGRRDRVREELADRSDEFEGRGQGKMVIGSTAAWARLHPFEQSHHHGFLPIHSAARSQSFRRR